MKLAFEQILQSQESMKRIYNQWNAPNCLDTKILYDEMCKIVKSDDKITKEYHGLNTVFVSAGIDGDSQNNFEEFMALFECSLQMGNQLSILMLEKVKECNQTAATSRI